MKRAEKDTINRTLIDDGEKPMKTSYKTEFVTDFRSYGLGIGWTTKAITTTRESNRRVKFITRRRIFIDLGPWCLIITKENDV